MSRYVVTWLGGQIYCCLAQHAGMFGATFVPHPKGEDRRPALAWHSRKCAQAYADFRMAERGASQDYRVVDLWNRVCPAKEYKPAHGGYPGVTPAGRYTVVYSDSGEVTQIGNASGLKHSYELVGEYRAIVFTTREDADEFVRRRHSPSCMYFGAETRLEVRKL